MSTCGHPPTSPFSLKLSFLFRNSPVSGNVGGVYTLVLSQRSEIYVTGFTELTTSHSATTEVCVRMRRMRIEPPVDEYSA